MPAVSKFDARWSRKTSVAMSGAARGTSARHESPRHPLRRASRVFGRHRAEAPLAAMKLRNSRGQVIL